MKIHRTTIIGKGYEMNQRKRQIFKAGFTLVELLTVMAIIAILISLLVPAVNLVRGYASEVKQKAQFHSIDVGMNLYKNDFGDYPSSNDNGDIVNNLLQNPDDPVPYGGAQKLAEAMVGWDLLGYHPKSAYRSDGKNTLVDIVTGVSTPDSPVYDAVKGNIADVGTTLAEKATNNLKARKGPYIELENANAFKMEDIYTSANYGLFRYDAASEISSNYVICDAFAKTRPTGKKTGMPVLYYKARTEYTQQDYLTTDPVTVANDDIYYYADNYNLLKLFVPFGAQNEIHLIGDGVTDDLDFENMILDPKMTRDVSGVKFQRPYKVDSYILISAGQDGKYGTGDDIYNFEKE